MVTVSKCCFHCQRELAPGEAPLLIALLADDRCIVLCADCAAEPAVAGRFAQTAQRGRLAADDARQAETEVRPQIPVAGARSAQARARHTVVMAETALAQAIATARDAEAAVAQARAAQRQRQEPWPEDKHHHALSAPCIICGQHGASGTVALRRGQPVTAFSRLCPECDDAGEVRWAFITTTQLFQPQGIVYSASIPGQVDPAEPRTDS